METAYVQARWHQIARRAGVRQLRGPALRDHAVAADGPLPRHGRQRQGGSGRGHRAQRELRARAAAALLDRRRRAEARRHAAPRRAVRSRCRPTASPRSRRSRACSPAGPTRRTRRGAGQGTRTTSATTGPPMVAVACAARHGRQDAAAGHRRCPPGQTADADLRAALRNVFLHPNVGPFIGQPADPPARDRHPSPAYVDRVAAAFNDDGGGVRGDMKAVLRAILLDPEARGDAKTRTRATACCSEPVLYVTSLLRQLGAASDGNQLDEATRAMGQNVFYAPSVFNYLPGRVPDPRHRRSWRRRFGIHNTNTVLARSNFVYAMLCDGRLSGPTRTSPAPIGTKVDARAVARRSPPTRASSSPRSTTRLFGGGMPLGRQGGDLRRAALQIDDADERARTALFLATTSFQFQVQPVMSERHEPCRHDPAPPAARRGRPDGVGPRSRACPASRSAGASAQAAQDYKALVCVFLYGGNDSNDMVVPLDDYAALRARCAAAQRHGARRGRARADPAGVDLAALRPPSGARRRSRRCSRQRKLAVVCNVGTLVAPLTRARVPARGKRAAQPVLALATSSCSGRAWSPARSSTRAGAAGSPTHRRRQSGARDSRHDLARRRRAVHGGRDVAAARAARRRRQRPGRRPRHAVGQDPLRRDAPAARGRARQHRRREGRRHDGPRAAQRGDRQPRDQRGPAASSTPRSRASTRGSPTSSTASRR